MTIATFILKNALRNRRRALLTIISVAVSSGLLVTLLTLQRELTTPPESEAGSLRIIARNKVSLMQPLPIKQLAKVERIPGVKQVTPFTFFGGNFREESVTGWAQFAVYPARFRELIIEGRILAGSYEDFVKDRNSCLLGKDTLDRYKLQVGDVLKFTGTFYPVDLELRVAAVYAGTVDDRNCFFHHELLDQLLGGWGMTGTWYLCVNSPEVVNDVIRDVDAAFANTSAEVRAETERAFQLGFVSMFGNVKLLTGAISTVVIFTLILVSASTMSMAIRERFRELAVLKALGFRRRELAGFILAESFALSTLGGALGIGVVWAFWTKMELLTGGQLSLQKLTSGFMPYFEVTPRIMATAALVSAALGIVAAITPMMAMARTSVVEGLKTLD